MNGLKKINHADIKVGDSLWDVNTTTPTAAPYIHADVAIVTKWNRLRRLWATPQSHKLTKKERRYVGREIRKYKRDKKVMIAFFTDVIGTPPTDWQVRVLIDTLRSKTDYRLSISGRGFGRSAVQKVVNAYIAKDMHLISPPLQVSSRYRSYAEQEYERRQYEAERQRIKMEINRDQFGEDWHVRHPADPSFDPKYVDEWLKEKD